MEKPEKEKIPVVVIILSLVLGASGGFLLELFIIMKGFATGIPFLQEYFINAIGLLVIGIIAGWIWPKFSFKVAWLLCIPIVLLRLLQGFFWRPEIILVTVFVAVSLGSFIGSRLKKAWPINRKLLVLFFFVPFIIWGVIVLFSIEQPPEFHEFSGVMTDSRDGQIYRTIKLKDGKVWMAENLNFDIDSSWQNPYSSDKGYGRFYSWEVALKACPLGWHLPSDEEWRALVRVYGQYQSSAENATDDPWNLGNSGKAYKALSWHGSSGFDARGYYWTSTSRDAENAWLYYFSHNNTGIRWIRSGNVLRNYWNKSIGHYCRCVKD